MKQTISMLSVAFLLSALAFPPIVLSGEGHDHGDEAPAATNANAPKRLPDGDVFLPKQSQRQLGVRTVVASQASLPKTLELSGRVVMDPNAGGRVQASIAGRIEAGAKGFPALGQSVRKGEVLAMVRASASPIERANQVAQSAELRAQLDQAQRRVSRFAQLEGSIAQKDRDAAQSGCIQPAAAAGGSAGERIRHRILGGACGRRDLCQQCGGRPGNRSTRTAV
jgi:membrane fusion protein, heavy metal efflux system